MGKCSLQPQQEPQHPLQAMLDEMEGLILHSFRNILAPKTAEVAKSLVEVQEALNIKSDELSKCTLSVIDTETLCLLGMIN